MDTSLSWNVPPGDLDIDDVQARGLSGIVAGSGSRSGVILGKDHVTSFWVE